MPWKPIVPAPLDRDVELRNGSQLTQPKLAAGLMLGAGGVSALEEK
jgi:hypothetical protein